MKNAIVLGRIFYGLGIAGIGLMHFFYPGFRAIVLPVPAAATESISILIYGVAIYFMISGMLIAVNKSVPVISGILAIVFFAFFAFGHMPIHLNNHPDQLPGIDTIKIFALCGGAFVLFASTAKDRLPKYLSKLEYIAPIGRYFFAIMLILFGTGHLLNAANVSPLVPKYIPFALFWTYLSGIALVGAGIAFLINFKIKYIAGLTGLMLFLWLISLHLYYAVRFPTWKEGENIIGSFECLAFCGIALLLTNSPVTRRKTGFQVKKDAAVVGV